MRSSRVREHSKPVRLRVHREAMPFPRKLAVQLIALAAPASDVAQEGKPAAKFHVGELPDDGAIEEQPVDPNKGALSQRRTTIGSMILESFVTLR
jgi:hypothetical protein